MAKQKKKRNKKYSGADARVVTPTVMRVSAEEISPFQEWWRTYGRLVKAGVIIAIIIVVLIVSVIGIIGIFSR